MYFLNGPNHFCLFSFFSHDKYSTNLTIIDTSIDGVLGTWTQDGRRRRIHYVGTHVNTIFTIYFQCSAVSLVSPTSQSACSLVVPQSSSQFQQLQQENNSLASSQIMESSHTSLPIIGPVVTSACEILSHRFQGPSRNCDLKNNNTTCTRHAHAVSALVFASHCFEPAADSEDTFEIRIDQVNPKYSGSLRLGITTRSPGINTIKLTLP